MDIRERMKLFHENPVVAWHEHASGGKYNELDLASVDRYVEVMDLYGFPLCL